MQLGAEWQRFLSVLNSHEQSHVDMAHQYFDQWKGQVISKTPQEAEQILQQIRSSLQAASDQHDSGSTWFHSA